jgi:hypothetical protein
MSSDARRAASARAADAIMCRARAAAAIPAFRCACSLLRLDRRVDSTCADASAHRATTGERTQSNPQQRAKEKIVKCYSTEQAKKQARKLKQFSGQSTGHQSR